MIRKAYSNSASRTVSSFCLPFNVSICGILNFGGQVSIYFLHLIFILQAYAVPIVLLWGYFGLVWRRLLRTWCLVLLRELLPPFLQTRRTYFKHSPNTESPLCPRCLVTESHRSRLKELLDQEKKKKITTARWRSKVRWRCIFSSNEPFLYFPRMMLLWRYEATNLVHSSSTIRKQLVLYSPALFSTFHLPLLSTGLRCAVIYHGSKTQ